MKKKGITKYHMRTKLKRVQRITDKTTVQ